ncbi:MAG: hypothetical protein JWO58_103 [Chitinophagaceae bacterium]|nr:hypothetical protein [Chitinophagaceae bacterium]
MPMTINFTKNDLTRYVYNDLNEQDTNQLQLATLIDEGVHQFCDNLQEVAQKIDQSLMEPSQKSIDAILLYAKKAKLGA